MIKMEIPMIKIANSRMKHNRSILRRRKQVYYNQSDTWIEIGKIHKNRAISLYLRCKWDAANNFNKTRWNRRKASEIKGLKMNLVDMTERMNYCPMIEWVAFRSVWLAHALQEQAYWSTTSIHTYVTEHSISETWTSNWKLQASSPNGCNKQFQILSEG